MEKFGNKIDGKFNIVKKIGKPTPTSSISLKNFNSSRMFIIKIKDEKIKCYISKSCRYTL